MFKKFFDTYVLTGDGKPVEPVQVAPNTSALGVAPSTTVVANNEFVTALRNAIKARPTAYTALLQAADKLGAIIPDANTRLKAAFATVSGEGRGLKEVLGALDVHLADLESQRMQFAAALAKQKQDALGVLQLELDAIKPANDTATQQITNMTEQIRQLQDQIAKAVARGTSLQTEIITKTSQFAVTEQQFTAALATVKTELDGQKIAVTSVLS